MQNIFIISTLVVLVFIILKAIEVKYIIKDEEFKGIKEYVRDAVAVIMSALISTYVYFTNERSITELFIVVTDDKQNNSIIGSEKVEVFTDNPNF
jgi:hypothetical protein